VRNVETTINGTLESSKNTCSCGCPYKTNIKVAMERIGSLSLIKLLWLVGPVFSSGLFAQKKAF